MATNYDTISDDYQKAADHPIKRCCEAFTFARVLGDVRAKAVLDLACGNGYYTRLIKRQGAAQVVGVDVSARMIASARRIETAAPLGIDYQIGDVTTLGKIGQFDVVAAVFLFPYASTKQALTAMFQTIYDNLKPTAKLISITLNPNLSVDDLPVFRQYGVNIQAKAGLRDKAMVTFAVVAPNGSSFELQVFYWQEATLESVIRQVGFREIRWHPIRVSDKGIKAYGASYWQAYSKKPYGIVLECAT
jgi:2-polyprenyl-3-methyl-5-hydroxy-6-metoxy-1,4-benzoquinol methylase